VESKESTLKSFRKFLCGNPERKPNANYSLTLIEFARANGLVYLEDFKPEHVTMFRSSWKVHGHAMQVQSERLKQYFNHCEDTGYITTNPAKKLPPPNVKHELEPVVAFDKEERDRLLAAVADNEFLLTFNLTMKHTGLALVDMIHLGPAKLHGDHIVTRRMKTKTKVSIKLPPEIVQRLQSLPVLAGGYWFWNRKKENSKHETATGNLRRMMRPYFKQAEIFLRDEDGNIIYQKDANGNTVLDENNKPVPRYGHPHQWRHTFVHWHLMNDTPILTIAAMIGDSILVMMKTYAHFITERQAQLDKSAERSWDQEELAKFRLGPKIVKSA
jgi:integrase